MMVRFLFGAFLAASTMAPVRTAQAQNTQSAMARLEGTVVNAQTRQPITGALIQAAPLPDQKPLASSRTRTDGSFVLLLDPTRTYSILTRADGYKDREEKLAFSDQRAERLYGKQIRLEPGTELPRSTMPVVLPTIQFAARQADLSPDALASLRQIAALLVANPGVRIEAAGHTDTIGDIALNRMLALERAETVRTFLVQQGIAKNRVEVRSYGGTKPLPGPLTPERRAKNKRVELIIRNQ